MEIINKHSCVVTNFVCREGNSLYKENSDNEFEYEVGIYEYFNSEIWDGRIKYNMNLFQLNALKGEYVHGTTQQRKFEM